MAQKPSYVTGASAKILIGTETIAYATDVSYRATTETVPVEVMGRYEVLSNEPIAYRAEGTLSVIRYTSKAADMEAADDNGNDISRVYTYKNLDGSQQTAQDGFDPIKLLLSRTWDLKVYQKKGATTNPEKVSELIDCRFSRLSGSIDKRGILVEQYAFNAILLNTGESDVAVTPTDATPAPETPAP